jgi:hypothetical protein
MGITCEDRFVLADQQDENNNYAYTTLRFILFPNNRRQTVQHSGYIHSPSFIKDIKLIAFQCPDIANPNFA